jgi:hypothetical protein
VRSVPCLGCRDADAVLVVPVAEDEREDLAAQTVRSSGIRDAVLCLDGDAVVPWAERLGHVVRCEGFGIGKALDAGFKYALQLRPEWIVKSDAHVRFAEPAWTMLRPELAGFVLLPPHKSFEWGERLPLGRGLTLDLETWQWRWNMDAGKLLPCITDPVYAVHSSLVREVLRWQPWVFAVPYWGKEAFDFTLTLTRLGHPVLPVDRPVVEHWYKGGGFPEERVRRRCVEPWCPELGPGESAYFYSMGIGDAIFALRHYREPQRHRFWGRVERWVPVARRYFPDRARYVGLRYPTEAVMGEVEVGNQGWAWWLAAAAAFAATLGLGYLAGRAAKGRG